MSLKSLILYPRNPRQRLRDWDSFLQGLREVGLIGEVQYPQFPHEYTPGHSFRELIVFSSHHWIVRLVPDASGKLQETPPAPSYDFCSIRVRPEKEVPRVLASLLTEPPKCRLCGTEEPEWGEVIDRWWSFRDDPLSAAHTCRICGNAIDINEFDWDRTCGVGWSVIEIESVARGEAIPSRRLMNHLLSVTDGPWDYCYYRL